MPKVFSLATARRMATDSTAINALYLPAPGIRAGGLGAEGDIGFAKPKKNRCFEELYKNTQRRRETVETQKRQRRDKKF